MHRTQILLEDEQYERLRERSRASGTAIGELIRRAVDRTYGSLTTRDRLLALDESFGCLDADFDVLDGADYVDRERRGLDHRLSTTVDE